MELMPPVAKGVLSNIRSLTTTDTCTYMHFDVNPFYTYEGLAHQLSLKRQMVVVGVLSVLLLEGWFEKVQQLCLLVQVQMV